MSKLQSSDEYPNSAYMKFDFDFMAVFGSKGKIPVCLSVDGHRYRSTIAVYAGVHMMVFNANMRRDTGYKAGDKIHITLERDSELRRMEIPPDVKVPLMEEGVWDEFEKYSYSHQKETMDWINDTKKQETRLRRIAKLVDKLTKD